MSIQQNPSIWTKHWPKPVSELIFILCGENICMRLKGNNNNKFHFGCFFLCAFVCLRVWCIQLFPHIGRWHHIECGVYGNMRHWICIARIAMWFTVDGWSKRHSWSGYIFGHNLFVACLGLFGRYQRTTMHYSTNAIDCIHFIRSINVDQQFLHDGEHAVFEWIFVRFVSFPCSIRICHPLRRIHCTHTTRNEIAFDCICGDANSQQCYWRVQ